MQIDETKLSEGDNLKLRVLQLKSLLPKAYVPLFVHYYPQYNNDKAKWKIREVVNLRQIDRDIIGKLEKLVELLRGA